MIPYSADVRMVQCGNSARFPLKATTEMLDRYLDCHVMGDLDRPLSPFITPEFIFERREKRPRCGKVGEPPIWAVPSFGPHQKEL
jgi:hypothetical protein